MPFQLRSTMQHVSTCQDLKLHDIPVLKPDLYLSRTQSRYFARKTFAMTGVWMGLASKFAHEKASLAVCESATLSAR